MTARFTPDPRTRLVIVFSLTCGALLFNRPEYLAALLLLTVIISALLGKWGAVIKKRIGGLLALFIFLTVLQSIFNHTGETVLSILGFSLLTTGGILQGVCFLCRMTVIILSSTILLAASTRKMIQGLIAFKLPFELAFMTSIAISFLPSLAEDMQNSLTAFQLRGVDLKKIPFPRRMKVYFYLLQPVLRGIVVKARDLSIAMEMRAFRAFDERGSYTILTLKKPDYIIITVTVAMLTAALTAYYCGL